MIFQKIFNLWQKKRKTILILFLRLTLIWFTMHMKCRSLSGCKARWRHDHGVCRWNRDARVRRWAHSLTDSRLAERGIPALALSSVRCTRRRGSLARRLLPHSYTPPSSSSESASALLPTIPPCYAEYLRQNASHSSLRTWLHRFYFSSLLLTDAT